MIERLLKTALSVGIDSIVADPTILDTIFGEKGYELSNTEIDSIKTVFAAKTPNVIHQYPRKDSEFPLYAIVLGVEAQGDHYLGDVAGQIEDDDDPDFGSDVLSAIWTHKYNVLVCTDHPDVTLYYYQIAKSMLMASSLPNEGLFEMHLSGADLAPDPKYIPEHLFIRILTFGCSSEFVRVDLGSRLGKAFRVAGIHIDKNGSPGDVGGVKTLVTIASGDNDGT